MDDKAYAEAGTKALAYWFGKIVYTETDEEMSAPEAARNAAIAGHAEALLGELDLSKMEALRVDAYVADGRMIIKRCARQPAPPFGMPAIPLRDS